VFTSVVDRGPFAPGREFEVTPALADLLGLSGVQTIRWSFARAG
jgi:rare lipoprotein A (peptidoglycan hydrolase)